MSKKKLERMTVVGGDFRKAGLRSRGEFSQEQLQTLLSNDIKDIQQKTLVAGLQHIEKKGPRRSQSISIRTFQ